MPFWTRSGRNQPSGRDKVFLLSLPSWLHGLIAPPPGWGMALLDWKAQEIGIAAGLSGDPALIADFQAGDPHMGFAIRAGLAPPEATAETHGEIRTMVKPISLGSQYGMSKYGAAAQSGKSLAWAATTLAAHRHAYPVFIQWQQNVAAQALFDERIASVFGWPMAVHAGTKQRTLLNYPAQANGAECMRVAAIAAYEAGIRIAAPAHDAFWIMAPLSELDDTIAAMTEIMVTAGRAVAGIDIPVDVSAEVRLAATAWAMSASRKPRAMRCGPRFRRCSTAARCRPWRHHEEATSQALSGWAGPGRNLRRPGQAEIRSDLAAAAPGHGQPKPLPASRMTRRWRSTNTA